MKVIISHPTTNQNSRAVLNGLYQNKLLFQFYTSLAFFPDSTVSRLNKYPAFKSFERRTFPSSIKAFTKTSPLMEMARLLSLELGFKSLTKHEKGRFCVDANYHRLDRKVSKGVIKAASQGVKALYAYEDGACKSFETAKELGIKCYYDLPIAYWEYGKKLLLEEASRLPDWAPTFLAGINDSEAKLRRKTKELELADTILVPSTFVRDSLPSWAADKQVILSPFGSPLTTLNEPKKDREKSDQILRVLFVGSMTQRKGLADLFEAINLLDSKKIELVVLGALQTNIEFYNDKVVRFTHEKGRSHSDVLALMRTCDVFCLPSLVEGRALVMQEAMSQGLPIIITSNTGGEDLVIEGDTGFLVPMRSPEKIADRLRWCLDNRSQLKLMGEKSKAHASKYTWDAYVQPIVEALKADVNSNED